MATFKNRSVYYNFSLENTEEDNELLKQINKQKGELLIPIILYTVVLMVVGSVGNPLAIYIYGWKWQNTTTRVFLFWLAVIDLINCLVTMPTEIYVMTTFYYFPNAGFCRMSRFITYITNNSTSAIFVAIAFDRYARICHPHRTQLSIVGAQLACIFSLALGVGVSWPALVLYGSKKIHLPSSITNKGYIWGCICDVKNEMDATPYPLAFFIYLWCAFLVCVLILSVIYILIGKVMLQRRRNKRKTTNEPEAEQMKHTEQKKCKSDVSEISQCQEDPNSGDTKCGALQAATTSWRQSKIGPAKSTLMLFAITAVFVVSFLPFLIITTVRQHFGSTFYPSLSPAKQVITNLFLRSYLVNNCTNPIVYGMCNTQFRDQIKKLFRMSKTSRSDSFSRDETGTKRGFPC